MLAWPNGCPLPYSALPSSRFPPAPSPQRQLETLPLGSSGRLSFRAPAVLDSDTGLFFAAVAEEPQHSAPSITPGLLQHQQQKQQFLVSWSSSSAGAHRKQQQRVQQQQGPRSLSDIPQRINFPGSTCAAAHSLHAMQPGGSPLAPQTTATPPADNLRAQALVAAVLADGGVCSSTGDALELSAVAAPPALASPVVRLCATCSAGPLLLTLHHAAQEQHALLRTFAARHTPHGPALALAQDTDIPCPSPHTTPTSMHLAPTYVLIAWSSGATTAVQLSSPPSAPGPSQPLKLQHFPPPRALADACPDRPAGTAASAAAHASVNGAATPASARKRKAPSAASDAPPNTTAPLLAAPLDDTQLVVAVVRAASASSSAPPAAAAPTHELHFAVLERQFGVVLHSGAVALEGALLLPTAGGPGASKGTARSALPPSQPSMLASPGSSPGTVVLQVR